jgi:hypothetical protein
MRIPPLEKERGLSREQYLRDILYPAMLVEKLKAIGPFTSLEELKNKGHVEVFFDEPGGRGRSAQKSSSGSVPQQDRLGVAERKLDEVTKSLESLRRELERK